MERCGWCEVDDLYRAYHDQEWGVPVTDDDKLFEFLILEGMQAGLNWHTILKKRENFRSAYDNFNAKKIAAYGQADMDRLMADAGCIRNQLKIKAAIQNARGFLTIQQQEGSFAKYLWRFTDNQNIQNNFKTLADVPAQTALSQAISKDLKKRGFNFVGPTIMYAFMQAVGMVNDHLVTCPRHKEIGNVRHKF